MSCTKGSPGPLAERRLTDVGNMQPIWKLYGNGSVGSQALLGIPHLTALRNDAVLSPVSRLWPFEIGLGMLPARLERDCLIVHTEIYPSLLPIQPAAGEVKDAAQVTTMAAHFAALDDAGELPSLFAGPTHLTPEQRETIEQGEGWTLGVLSAQQARPSLASRPLPYPPSTAATVTGRHRAGSGRTTAPGYQNRNSQIVVRSTGLTGTDHGQTVDVLQCGVCGHEYGANGSDISASLPSMPGWQARAARPKWTCLEAMLYRHRRVGRASREFVPAHLIPRRKVRRVRRLQSAPLVAVLRPD